MDDAQAPHSAAPAWHRLQLFRPAGQKGAAVQLDSDVLISQRDSLRDALQKVLDARSLEAKASMSYQNARDNFSSSEDERKAHERAMLAASDAEREARLLLATLRIEP